ncbi:MAG: DUF2837 family protein [Verrucomicrobiae bacterium]|nr:DUF2837 family protein [Verrucomicrobiae bacterium]
MDGNLLFLCILSVAIHLISTLSYAVRIAGVRTGRLAFALSLFNLLVLFSRSSNAILAPLLSKRTEEAIAVQASLPSLIADFRWLLVAASVGTLAGGLLIPTFQRIVTAAVGRFAVRPSMLALLVSLARPRTWFLAIRLLSRPSSANWTLARVEAARLPWGVFVMNVLGVSLITTGVFASLLAGHFVPELRLTAGNLSAAVNFIGTIVMFAMVDPNFSFLSDKVVAGEATERHFRACVIGMWLSRLGGTIAAQAVLVPGAWMIAWLAQSL